MNNTRITNFLDNLLREYEQTPDLLEQKEELTIHLTERVQDYMAKGLTYDEAYEATIKSLGDLDALIAGMAPIKAHRPHYGSQDTQWGSDWEGMGDADEDTGRKKKKRKGKKGLLRRNKLGEMLTALSPFIYLILGLTIGGRFWAWGWMIIPLAPILFFPDKWQHKVVAASPFIYLMLGFFLGWWAWGWLIIPISAIVLCHD